MNFTVQIASPMDQQHAAEAASEAVSHLNDLLAPSGHTIVTKNWQKNLAGGRSDRPQEVINDQTTDIDALVAIFGFRVGSDTGKFMSGTVEEIERFLERRPTSETRYDMQIFFNNSPPDNPQGIDAEQLAKVHSFRDSLSSRGISYSYFSNLETLKNLVRLGLNLYVSRKASSFPVEETGEAEELEELGSFDAIELAQEYLNAGVKDIQSITDAFTRWSHKVQEFLSVAEGTVGGSANPRTLLDSAAASLRDFHDALRDKADSLRSNFSSSHAHLSLAVTIELEDGALDKSNDDTVVLSGSLNGAIAAAEEALSGINQLRASTASLPRKTKEINSAKRKLLNVFDHIRQTISDFIQDQKSILKMLE